MPTYTTTYSLGKPVVGADEDAWGDTLNASLDSIDDILDGTTPVTGIDINSGTIDNVVIGGATPAAGTFTTLTANTSITGTLATAAQTNITSVGTLTGLTVSASASLAGASTSADITFGDNDKAIFGAGSDLQIYHDGNHSYVSDQGTGNIKILADDFIVKNSADTETMIQAFTDAAVSLWYDNSTKLTTTSTGVDITGTLTSDGLTVEPNTGLYTTDATISNYSSSNGVYINGHAGGWLAVRGDGTGFTRWTLFGGTTGNATLHTNNKNRITVDGATGDISFYEDTGTTAKFFWDASAESLGIGTSSPNNYSSSANDLVVSGSGQRGITIASTDSSQSNLFFADSDSGAGEYAGYLAYVHSTDHLAIATNSTERIRIKDNDVFLGPAAAGTTHRFFAGTGATAEQGLAGFTWSYDDRSSLGLQIRTDSLYSGSYPITFGTTGSSDMTLDASGNLLVANTTGASADTGHIFAPTGIAFHVRDGGIPLVVDRLTDDGDLQLFRKDGTTVGSIGSASGATTYIDGGSQFAGLQFGGDGSTEGRITPRRNGASADGQTDLGTSSLRFKDLYLSGGVYLGGTIEAADYTSNSGSTNGYVIRQSAGSASSSALMETVTSATSARYHLAFRNGATSGNSSGSIVGSISTSSTSTSYNTSSDYRLKENVVELTGATTRLKQLEPKRFNFIADAGTTVDGFLAHEVQSVVPEAITGTQDGMRDEEYEVTPAVLDDDGNVITEAVMGTRSVPDYQGIDQSKLVPLLVATIKELEARITALENA
jgi:hypothetical protein